MRVAAAFIVLAVMVGACSATSSRYSTPEGAPGSSTSSTETSTSTTSTTALAVAVVEPATPLFFGEKGDRWREAWSTDDFDTLSEFFAEGAAFNGRLFETVRSAVGDVYVDAYGWDEFFEDCVHHSARYATCEARWTSDLHRAAGVEVRVHREVFFDDAGLITAFNDHEDLHEFVAFHVAFHEWLAIEHPEIEPLVYGWYEVAVAEPNIRAAIGVVGDFVAQSDTYPLGGPTTVADPVLSGSVDGVDVYNATSEQITLVRWALERFTSAGLPPPPVSHVTFPPTAACVEGFSGMSYHTDTGGHIDVCASWTQLGERADALVPLAPRRTILHELGHLWTSAYVDDGTRQAFIDLLHLEAWSGVGWESSGSEHAAEILMWGLIDTRIEPRAPNTTCEDHMAAFALLAGIPVTSRTCG